jgi:hypothetical protein
MAKDETFGNIEWDGDLWTSTLSVPYLRGCGERVKLTEDDRDELPPGGGIQLRIETGEVRRRPAEPQRAAWQTLVQRGDAMWDDVLDALIAEYQLQRPNRVRYWKTLNGERLLSRSMPAAVDRALMKQMIVPLWCTVQEPDPEHGTVDVYLTMLSTWFSEPLNVYVRDGRVTEVTAMGFFMNRKMPWIETATFGKLRRRPKNRAPWFGEIRLEPFRPFAAVAVDRWAWDESYTRSDEATSDLPWNPARGCALLGVQAKPSQPPTAGQAAVFEEFMKRQDANAAAIVEAVFNYYGQTAPARRKAYRGPNRDAAFPVLKDARGLQDLIELPEMSVFPDESSGPIAIGFLFRGTWTGSAGIGVRWREGKIEQVGEKEVAGIV